MNRDENPVLFWSVAALIVGLVIALGVLMFSIAPTTQATTAEPNAEQNVEATSGPATGDSAYTTTTEIHYDEFIENEPGFHDGTGTNVVEAKDVATKFTAAWANASLSHSAWLAGMKPHTYPDFLADLETVDQRNIPATRVTGPAVKEENTDVLLIIRVPTDGGLMRVRVISDGRKLVVDAIEPAADSNADANPPLTGPGLRPLWMGVSVS